MRDQKKLKAKRRRWYERHSARHKAKVVRNIDVLRKKRMAELIIIKGGGCLACGYNRCSAALEFHHRDPTKKLFSLSVVGMTKTWSQILMEADKCDLLCSNCHRELHAEENENRRVGRAARHRGANATRP